MVAIDRQVTMQHRNVGMIRDTTARMKRLMARFSPISLSEMERVALLNRVDTKYLLDVSQLHTALQRLTGHYRVLEINRMRLNHYQTIYFDTLAFELYRQHHNGFGTRYKVRVRRYVDSNLAFLEVKHKTNQGRTLKSRYQTPELQVELDEQADGFVSTHTPLDADQLEPKLWNAYVRMTLVSKTHQERLTLDFNLAFGWGNAYVELPRIAIAEVKQEHLSQDSDFIQQMRELGIRATPFSKYCIGASLLYKHLKVNNFKPQLRWLQRIMQGEFTYDFSH